MKKKRSFITIISSIFGVAAICGLFALSSFGYKKQIETQAASYVIDTRSISSTTYYTGNYLAAGNVRGNTSNGDTILYYSGTAYYMKNVENNQTTYAVQFNFDSMMIYSNYLNFASFFSTSRNQDLYNFSVSTLYYPISDMSNDITLCIQCLSLGHVSSVLGWCDIRFAFYDGVNDTYFNASQLTFTFVIRDRQNYNLPSTSEFQYNACYNTNYSNGQESDFGMDIYNNFASPIQLIGFEFADIENAEYDDGFTAGYSSGYTDGWNQGYSSGSTSGYNQGFSDGQYTEHQNMLVEVQNAYNEGLNAGLNSDQTAMTVFSGILNVALVPINFFLACFNFEILGINLSAFIRALFTVVLTIVVVKLVLGNSGGGD